MLDAQASAITLTTTGNRLARAASVSSLWEYLWPMLHEHSPGDIFLLSRTSPVSCPSAVTVGTGHHSSIGGTSADCAPKSAFQRSSFRGKTSSRAIQ